MQKHHPIQNKGARRKLQMNEVTIAIPTSEKRTIAHYYKDKKGVNRVALFEVHVIPGFLCNLKEVARKCFEDEQYRKQHCL